MASAAQGGWGSSSVALAEGFDLLLLDLDGVVYVGPDVVPGAAESIERAVAAGLVCSFVTNNAARPPGDVSAHLRALGIAAEDGDVVTSAQEGAELLATLVPASSQVLAVGGPGVSAALEEVGLQPVTRFRAGSDGSGGAGDASGGAGVVGVLQGYGPDVSWRDLAEATYAVQAGATWVATNPDLTVPTPRGTAPGNGQLTAVVARTTGVAPRVTGKPGPGLFISAVKRAGGGRALVVGDRLDTDIAGAVAAELPSLLVLTGVSGARELLAAEPHERPTYISADLGGLWQAHPRVREEADGWVCGAVRARLAGSRIEISTGPSDQGASDRPSDQLDGLRAVAAAAWSARDTGRDVDLDHATESVESLAR
jgi:glycerol-1-phosphatase